MTKILIKNDIYPLLKLAVPLALTGLVQSSSWFFETLFLAHVNHEVLAAGALVNWLLSTLVVILYGTLGSINILVAHKHGANDSNSISFITRDGVWLAAVFSILIFTLLWNIAPVFLTFGQSPSVVLLAKSYLHALVWGLPASFISIACLEVIMGLGHARVIFVFSILTVSANILSSYTLIFGKFGFPKLGIAGAGWAVTISYWLTISILIIFIAFNKKYRIYFSKIFNFAKPSYLYELIQIGVPIGLMFCVEVGFFFAMTLVMGTFGSIVQAANQIALQYLGLLMSVVFSIAQAITVRMGHLIGAKNYLPAKNAAYIGISIAGILLSLIGFVFWFFPMTLIGVDLHMNDPRNSEMIILIKNFLSVSAIFQIVEAIRIAFFGALRGLKDTKFTLFTSIISFWLIALPIGFFIATHANIGPSGLWWGMVMGATVSILLLEWRFRSKFTKVLLLKNPASA